MEQKETLKRKIKDWLILIVYGSVFIGLGIWMRARQSIRDFWAFMWFSGGSISSVKYIPQPPPLRIPAAPLSPTAYSIPDDWEEYVKRLDPDPDTQNRIKGVIWGNKLIVELQNSNKMCLVEVSCNDETAIDIVKLLLDTKPNIHKEIKKFLS